MWDVPHDDVTDFHVWESTCIGVEGRNDKERLQMEACQGGLPCTRLHTVRRGWSRAYFSFQSLCQDPWLQADIAGLAARGGRVSPFLEDLGDQCDRPKCENRVQSRWCPRWFIFYTAWSFLGSVATASGDTERALVYISTGISFWRSPSNEPTASNDRSWRKGCGPRWEETIEFSSQQSSRRTHSNEFTWLSSRFERAYQLLPKGKYNSRLFRCWNTPWSSQAEHPSS